MLILIGILLDCAALLALLALLYGAEVLPTSAFWSASLPAWITPGGVALGLAGVLHLGACVAFTRVIYRRLPRRYRGFRRQVPAFLMTLQVLLPILGTLGFGLAFHLAARPERASQQPLIRTLELPELPFEAPAATGKTRYSEAGLSQVLHEAPSLEKRVEALIATKQMKRELAVPLLKAALRDSADDVRLLAYSLLDMTEKQLSANIREGQKRWQSALAEERHDVGLTLANQYWDLVFLGLVSGSNREKALQAAYTLLEDLVREQPSATALHLLGRVGLALGMPAKAALRFRQAMEAGGNPSRNLPYIGEALFDMRQYHRLPCVMRSLSAAGGYSGKHEALIRLWLGEGDASEESGSWLEGGGYRAAR